LFGLFGVLCFTGTTKKYARASLSIFVREVTKNHPCGISPDAESRNKFYRQRGWQGYFPGNCRVRTNVELEKYAVPVKEVKLMNSIKKMWESLKNVLFRRKNR